MNTENTQNFYRKFLLGSLPESEANALETDILADDERFEQVWATENQLVDDYVRGQLIDAERERFEQHYLVSPRHAQRVAFAKKLINEADQLDTDPTPTETKATSTGFFALFNARRPAWGYALAALVLLLAAVSVWLLMERSRLRSELTQVQNTEEKQRRALEDEVAAARERSDKLSSELEQLRTHGPSTTPSPPPPAAKVFAFVLSPILVRGSGDPQTLNIPSGTDAVRLRMSIGKETASHFQILVKTVEGQQIWSQTVRKSGGGNVFAEIAASRLRQGDYILTLSAVKADGGVEELNRYFFRVGSLK